MEELLILILIIFVLSFLGMVVAFSPTLVITEVTVLLKSKNPFWHTIALISGISLAIVIYSFIATLAIDPSEQITIPFGEDKFDSTPIIDALTGLGLILLGIKFLKEPKKHTSKSRFKPENLLNTKTLFWFGLLKMFTSISSLVAIILAARLIKTFLHHGTTQFIAVFWLIVVSILPFVLIAAAKAYKPGIFKRIESSFEFLKLKNWRKIICTSAIIVGALFVFSSVIAFL